MVGWVKGSDRRLNRDNILHNSESLYYNIIYLISDGSVTGTRGGYPPLQNRDPDP